MDSINPQKKILSLDEQIEIFRTAFESSYDGIHILDKKGNTLYINKACERIEGINYREAQKINIRDMVKQGIYSESVTLKVLKAKKPVTIIQKVKNGNEILATGTPIFKNEKIDKIIVNSRDITELNTLKKKLKENEYLAKKYKDEIETLRKESLKNSNIVANSKKMKKIEKMCLTASKVDSTVLIQGESGVGKSVLSKFIHTNSHRKNGPFIKIDCSAIPENLFESEIFGYEPGSFTGARKSGKIGLIELANEGTIFLDEIGDLSLSSQPKILRAIQDKEIIRVGGNTVIPIDVRIIAATNKDLISLVKKEKFREDLYYRLNVISINIPPLRDRKDDIYPLVIDILNKINQKYNMDKKISQKAMTSMTNYDWPGNVRELENIIESTVVMSDNDIIESDDILTSLNECNKNSLDLLCTSNKKSYDGLINEFSKKILLDCIKRQGSIKEASKELDLHVTTIRRKLHKYDIPKEEWPI